LRPLEPFLIIRIWFVPKTPAVQICKPNGCKKYRGGMIIVAWPSGYLVKRLWRVIELPSESERKRAGMFNTRSSDGLEHRMIGRKICG
jgi:hypothetical protein